MLDHVTLSVSDYQASKSFYERALRPLGYTVIMQFGEHAGMGVDGDADFWFGQGKKTEPHIHVCFRARDRKSVDAFHAAALSAGATELRPPGLQPEYHATYYGSFVRDLNGIDLEAVCHHG